MNTNTESTLYQVKLGTWNDNVDLGITMDKLGHDICDRRVADDEILSPARPTLAEMILVYHGGVNHETNFFDWDISHFDVISDDADVINVEYSGSFRRLNGDDDFQFSGCITILPQN